MEVEEREEEEEYVVVEGVVIFALCACDSVGHFCEVAECASLQLAHFKVVDLHVV